MHRRKQSCRNPCVALETKPGIREAVTTNKQAVIFFFFFSNSWFEHAVFASPNRFWGVQMLALFDFHL